MLLLLLLLLLLLILLLRASLVSALTLPACRPVDITHSRNYSVNLYTGTSSMLAAALGLAPSKDVFWSSTAQPGFPAKYPAGTVEAHPAVEAAVATYTAGPVAPGDKAGLSNATLLACSCGARGELLKPTYPATPVDAYFSTKAGLLLPAGAAAVEGELYATYSSIEGGVEPYVVAHALAIDLTAPVTALAIADVLRQRGVLGGGMGAAGPWFTWQTNTHDCGESSGAARAPALAAQATSWAVPACGKADFRLLHAAPMLPHVADTAWGLMGEVGKWVPTARARFSRLAYTPTGLTVDVRGTAGEVVPVRFAKATSLGGKKGGKKGKKGGTVASSVLATCTIGASGKARASTDGSCAAL